MIIYKITDTDASTLIGMNGGLIESPDGAQIIYARKKDITTPNDMELWVCNTDLTNHRHLYTGKCINHNGPSASFIDNSTIVFRDMSNDVSCFIIMDIDTMKIKYKIYAKEGHRAENGIYPFSLSDAFIGKNPDYPQLGQTGIYTLNVKTGSITQILSGNDILDTVKKHGLTPTEHTIAVSHVQLNPSATSIMARLSVQECQTFGALACFDIISGKTHMFSDKPVHQLWYDDDTYMATRQFARNGKIEMNTSYIARFTKDGKQLEVLGGIGNHIDASPDRTLIAGDRCYPEYSPDIFIYEKGSKKPIHTIHMNNLQKILWEHQVHPNPSFSKDGKRLYFNRPTSNDKTEASFIEL